MNPLPYCNCPLYASIVHLDELIAKENSNLRTHGLKATVAPCNCTNPLIKEEGVNTILSV